MYLWWSLCTSYLKDVSLVTFMYLVFKGCTSGGVYVPGIKGRTYGGVYVPCI